MEGGFRFMAYGGVHLLCTGDLHLGRYPSQVPSSLHMERLSPIFIWQKVVAIAIRDQVDALVITGDVVDEENRYYEAYGPFEAGVRELGERGITVLAVAGNHDYDTLPRLAQHLASPYFSCLGTGGRWEQKTICKGGRPVLTVMGWSYPTRRVKENPLDGFQPPGGDVPAVGLLHTALDMVSSSYAPVTSAQLQGMGMVGWILGHIHSGACIKENPPFILYPGSPQPLHPAETGVHGVWEVIIHPQNVHMKRIPLATLEYVHLTLDLSPLKEVEELPAFLSARIWEEIKGGGFSCPDRERVICQVTLTGRTPLHQAIHAQREQLTEELRFTVEGTPVIIEKLVNETRPRVQLEDLVQGKSPVALLAGYLLDLEQQGRDYLPEELIGEVETALHTAYSSNSYYPLRAHNSMKPPGREEALAFLKKQAWLLLDTLLLQKEEGP